MRKRFLTKVLCTLGVLVGWPLAADAVVVVHMDTVLGDIDIELYDDVAPQTVANFLNYVEDGDYEDSFIHRSVPDFVIQGGGFRMPVDQPEPVPLDPPVANEYSLPNVRGTIAMAKSAGDPDSATSQWFINLVDNTTTLGPDNNGGYTVFGRVIGNGMEVVDAIAALPIVNAGSPFETLPVIDFSGNTVLKQHLVIVNKIVVVTGPHIDVTPTALDFATPVPAGESAQIQVEISNNGVADLLLGTIADTDVVTAPFDIVADNCSGQTLSPKTTCTLTVRFVPEADGEFADSFNIPSNDPESPNVYMTITAVGGVPLPDIQVSPGDGLVIGEVLVGDTGNGAVTLTNGGDAALTVGNVSISGANALEFGQTNDCSVLDPGASCQITVMLTPADVGEKTATLTIVSDDPDQPLIDVPLSGSGRAPAPDIQVTRFFIFGPVAATQYHFGELLLGKTGSVELTISNQGEFDLVIDAIDVEGENAGDFSSNQQCSVIASGSNCKLVLEFRPGAEGIRSAVLKIHSNDPDEGVVEVSLAGIGRESWERYTIERQTGQIRLLAPLGTRLDRVGASDEPPPGDLPEGISFSQGFLKFALTLPQGSVGSAVAIVLPEGVTPTTYYKYGRTPDNAEPHWYEFMWDGYTGAVINGNIVTLYFLDGERGDDDLQRNGVILDPGAPGFSVMATEADAAVPDSESGGGGGGCSLVPHAGTGVRPMEWLAVLAFIAWLGLRRRRGFRG